MRIKKLDMEAGKPVFYCCLEAHLRPALLILDFKPMDECRPGFELMHGMSPGVVLSNGKYWKELRRFLLRNLRDFGFGKSSMENLFHEEVSKLCNILAKNEGQPIALQVKIYS